jgi:type IV secretory pathway TrbF-like protein
MDEREESRLSALAVMVDRLEQRIRAMGSWDDRMGRAVRASWWWKVTALSLLALLGSREYFYRQPPPEIIPYVYVMDRDGHIVERGVPGPYTVTDYQVMNILEEWLIKCRSRVDHRGVMADAWSRCQLTAKDHTQAREYVNGYMDREYVAIKEHPKTERAVLVTSKGGIALDRYRLEWIESTKLPNGQRGPEERMTGEFSVEIKSPRTREEAAKVWYGLLVTKIYWGSQTDAQGGL